MKELDIEYNNLNYKQSHYITSQLYFFNINHHLQKHVKEHLLNNLTYTDNNIVYITLYYIILYYIILYYIILYYIIIYFKFFINSE